MPTQPHANHSFLGRRFSAQHKIEQGHQSRIATIGILTRSIIQDSAVPSFERTAGKAGHFWPRKQHLPFCADS